MSDCYAEFIDGTWDTSMAEPTATQSPTDPQPPAAADADALRQTIIKAIRDIADAERDAVDPERKPHPERVEGFEYAVRVIADELADDIVDLVYGDTTKGETHG